MKPEAQQVNIPGVGETLKSLRCKRGFSQAQLSKAVGLDKASISKYENGHTAISVDVLDKIAAALGYRPAAVIILCLRERYPEFAESDIGQAIEGLVREYVEIPEAEAKE